MAIGAGSIVALKVSSAAFAGLGFLTAQPPVFGVAEGAAGGAVNWSNGTHVAAVAAGQLDEIVDANTTTKGLIGKIVNVVGHSASYNGLVIGAYNRGAAVECVLVKTLQNGAYAEYDATTVVVQANL